MTETPCAYSRENRSVRIRFQEPAVWHTSTCLRPATLTARVLANAQVQTGGRVAARRRDLFRNSHQALLVIVHEVENVMAHHTESTTEHRPVVSKTEARQGVTGHNVRYVLGFSLAAVIIAFAVIYFAYFG
jgi:hypothetical protein